MLAVGQGVSARRGRCKGSGDAPFPVPHTRFAVSLVQTATLRDLPTYVFAELDRLKAAARARGAALVDLGIGSPDLPMAPGVIDALARAAREPAIQGYPPFRGAPRFFDAIGRFMDRRFGVAIDPPREALALSGAKEGIAGIIAALCGPGDVVLVPEIYYPVYARAALAGGRRGPLGSDARRRRLRPRPRRDPGGGCAPRADDDRELPEQSHRRARRARRSTSAPSPSRGGTTCCS